MDQERWCILNINLDTSIQVGFIYSFSHSCFELQAKGILLAMTDSIQNCCKLLTSAEMSQGDTNKNVLAEFPLSLRYYATNILTDGVDKTFCPFTFFSVKLISTEIKVEEPLQFLWKFFSWHLLNIICGKGPKHFFRGFECFKNNFSYEGRYIFQLVSWSCQIWCNYSLWDWHLWTKDQPKWDAAFPWHLWKQDQLQNTFIFINVLY